MSALAVSGVRSEDRAIRMAEAAELALRSENTIRYHIDRGHLAAMVYDSCIWVSAAEVLDLFAPKPLLPKGARDSRKGRPLATASAREKVPSQERYERLAALIKAVGS